MRQKKDSRRASVIVLVALGLVAIVGFVAIVADGGLILQRSREVQSTADAAAMSAAYDLFYNYQSNAGLDPNGTAATAAKHVASDNGFTDSNSTRTVNIPPTSGWAKGKSGFAEVIVTYNQPRGFSNIFGSGTIPVAARSVARGEWASTNAGILLLDPTVSSSLTNKGGGTMTVVGAPIIVDSNSSTAMIGTGGSISSAPEFYVTGNPGYSGTFLGTINNSQPRTPDPLQYLPEPDPSTMVVQSKNATHYSGNSSKTFTISPGVYVGGISVTGQAGLSMAPGIYYMQGGGFSFTGQGGLTAINVMIFNAPSSNADVITINGGGSITLSPPINGIYTGISLWQQRSSTNNISITGNGSSDMTGTFYAQHGILNVTGNGSQDVLGSQYISASMVVNGNGTFKINWQANQVARSRALYLVE